MFDTDDCLIAGWPYAPCCVLSLNAVAPFIALSQKQCHYATILCVYTVSNATGVIVFRHIIQNVVQTGLCVISSLSF